MTGSSRGASKPSLSSHAAAFVDTLEERTFRWFWDLSDSTTGLTPDRAPTRSFVSVGAIGFALTAYPIGVERRSSNWRSWLLCLSFFLSWPSTSRGSFTSR